MKSCPYCGISENFHFKISSKIYSWCSECDLIYKDSQDPDDKVVAHYRDDYYSMYSVDQLGRKRGRLFDRILDLIEKKRRIGRLLDVGSGCGYFLATARKRGWKVKGIEPSIQSVEVARRQNGLDVYNGTLQEYDEKCKFDVITFINVLDHSVKPWKEIKKIYGLLKPRGIVYFRFPNGFLHIQTYRLSSKCGFADLIQKYLVFHEFSFTPRFVRRLLSDYGYADIEVYNANLSGERSERFSPIFSFISRSIEVVRKLTDLVTRGRILWGPSLEVIARKK